MKPAARLLAAVSLPAAAFALGCSSGNPHPYSADPGPARPAPAPASTVVQTPQPSMPRSPGWSAPVWRGPTTTTPAPYVPPAAPPPAAYTPPPTPTTTSYAFSWSSSLRQAQESARAQGKLIFLESGREACGNCQYIKNEVIPSAEVNAQLGSMSVGFYDDVDKTPYSDAFNLLQANVVGAGTLPLCGWVTPDLRWVHGFWGRRDPAKFLNEISSARSAYQRMAQAARPASSLELGRLPSAGSLPDTELADVSAELADDRMIEIAPPPAVAPIVDRPVLATTMPVPPPPPAPMEVAPPTAITPEPTPPVFASIAPERPAAAPTPVVTDVPVSDDAAGRAWVREQLKLAATELAAHRYAQARTILAGVRERAQGTPELREAEKGEVAIYNLRKIERAAGADDVAKLRATAQRDLKDTIWGSLFA